MKKLTLILTAAVLTMSMLISGAIAEGSEENFFPEDMKEYVNAEPAYSILYPAVFTEDMLLETEYGICAALPDQSASFLVYCQENTEGWNDETWVAAKLMEYPETRSEIHELNQLIHLIRVDGNTTIMTYCMVTEDWLYIAELSWNDMHPDFDRYCVYLENSFAADEVGLG